MCLDIVQGQRVCFPSRLILPLYIFCSTLGRIIKVCPEVLVYRNWTIKTWGAKQYANQENHGKVLFQIIHYCLLCKKFAFESWKCKHLSLQYTQNILFYLASVYSYLVPVKVTPKSNSQTFYFANVIWVVVFRWPTDVETCEQDLARLMLVSVEDQRDTASPLSADSSSSSPVFLNSPQHHSSSSSPSSSSSSSSSSGSDIVRPKDSLSSNTDNTN